MHDIKVLLEKKHEKIDFKNLSLENTVAFNNRKLGLVHKENINYLVAGVGGFCKLYFLITKKRDVPSFMDNPLIKNYYYKAKHV